MQIDQQWLFTLASDTGCILCKFSVRFSELSSLPYAFKPLSFGSVVVEHAGVGKCCCWSVDTICVVLTLDFKVGVEVWVDCCAVDSISIDPQHSATTNSGDSITTHVGVITSESRITGEGETVTVTAEGKTVAAKAFIELMSDDMRDDSAVSVLRVSLDMIVGIIVSDLDFVSAWACTCIIEQTKMCN